MHVPGVCGLMRRRSRPCRPRATAGAVTNARGILGETGAAERAAGAWNRGFTGMKKLLIGLGVVVFLLVAAAIVISLTPPASYNGEIPSRVTDETDRVLHIDGDAPFPPLTPATVSLC